MIMLTPVLERWSPDCPFWPADPTDFFLAVPRRPTPRQVGTVAWALIGRSCTADDLSVTAADAAAAIGAYLTSDDGDFASGGLRVTSDGLVVEPGCCVGLDEWRDWLRILDGKVIDLGHDPDVLVEHRGPVVRVWKDKRDDVPGEYIDVPSDTLPALLTSVQQDLLGFLDALRPWAREVAPGLADPLAAAVDRRLQISAPLGV